MIQFDKVNIVTTIVATMLCIALLAAIYFKQEQLAMSVASGLLGFIGGSTASNINKNEKVGNEK